MGREDWPTVRLRPDLFAKVFGQAPSETEAPVEPPQKEWVSDREYVIEAPKVPPRSKLLWVGVDLDGTIAEPLWTPENPTSEIGEPIWENLPKVDELKAAGYKVVIHTSRPWTDYEAIEAWLNHWDIPWHQIQCGKPLFALYVDDRGRHSEEESWLP